MKIGLLKGKLDGRVGGYPDGTVECDVTGKTLKRGDVYVYAAVKRGSKKPYVRILSGEAADDMVDEPQPGVAEALFEAMLDRGGEYVLIDASQLELVRQNNFDSD